MSGKPIKVLIVEDSPQDARLLREAIVEEGASQFELAHVDRLSEAASICGTVHFDLILLDLSLPDGQGLDTLVRAREQLCGVPIVVLTGLDDETMAVEAVRQGAQDYLIKNQVDSRALLRSMRCAVERHIIQADHTDKEARRPADSVGSIAAPLRDEASDYLATAVALHMHGKVEEALGYLETARQQGENRVEVHSGLAEIYFERKQYAEAAAACWDLLAIDPNNAVAKFQLGLCCATMGSYQEAAKAFTAVIQEAPELVDAHLALAAVHTKTRDYIAAQAAYETYLKIHGDSFAARCGLGESLHLSKQHEPAIATYQNALQLEPDSPEVLVNLGAVYSDIQDFENAVSCHQQLLKARPDGSMAHAVLAYASFRAGRCEDACEIYHCIVKTEPQSFAGWYNLGVTRQKLGRHQEAVVAYLEAVRLRPEAVEAHVNLAISLQEQDQNEEAAAEYQQALSLDGKLENALYNLALTYEKRSKEAQAVECYERLLATKPAFLDARFRLARIWQKRREWEKAAAAYEQCVSQKRDWPEALSNLGITYLKLGKLREAEDALRQVLNLRPDDPQANLALAGIHLKNQNFEEAHQLFCRLAELKPANLEALFQAGQETQNRPRPIHVYDQAVSQQTDFAEACFNRAIAQQVLRAEVRASKAFENAIRLKPEVARAYFAVAAAGS